MGKLVSSLLVLIGSTFKFSMGSLTAIFYNLGLAGSLANIIGGTIGIVLFTYLGDFIQTYFVKISCFALTRIKPPLWVY